MAQKPNPAAQSFARYVKDAANKAGYTVGQRGGDGEAKLAEAAQMSEADITMILNGQYEAPLNLLKSLATALGVEQKVLLRKAGILEGRTAAAHQPLTAKLAARHLGIKDPRNVAALEILTNALIEAEKRRR